MRFVLPLLLLASSLSAATFTVTTTADTGAGSLRQAVTDSNLTPGTDDIQFNLPPASTIAMASALTISDSANLRGPGARDLTITASGSGYRFALVNNGATLQVFDLTINAFLAGANTGGAFGTTSSPAPSNIALTRVAVRGCQAASSGVVQVNGSFRADSCEFSGNSATTGSGGVLSSSGSALTIINCTFSGNSAAQSGGAIMTFAGTASLTACTFAGNTAGNAGGALNSGSLSAASFTLRNTLLAGNTATTGPNGSGQYLSMGYNLVHVVTGMSMLGVVTDIIGQDPLLQPLANNGGPTNTRALAPNSPAVDFGDAGAVLTDQRGFTRPKDITAIGGVPGGGDIGAFELTPTVTSPTAPIAFGVATPVGQFSAPQPIDVQGRELVGTLVVTAPAQFELATAAAGPFQSTPLNLAPDAAGAVTQTVYVRHAPTAAGQHAGNVVLSSVDATAFNLGVAASATAPLNPTIAVTGTLAPFESPAVGVGSAEQSYTVSGADLTAAISISAPTGFEVSLTSGAGFASSVNTAAPTAGTVAPTTVFVRYLPMSGTAHNGNLDHASTGAVTQTLAVSGTIVPPDITVNGTLTPFVSPLTGGPSPEQTYQVSGVNLVAAISINAPTGFEVSLTAGTGFVASLNTPAPVAGVLAPTFIFVRYYPTSGTAHTGDIDNSSQWAVTRLVSVDGSVATPPPPTPVITVLAALTPFSAAPGGVSPEQTYTVAGTDLTGQVTITAPTGFEVSLSAGTGFAASVDTPAPVAGMLAAVTVFVRYAPTTGTTHNGTISHSSAGAATVNLAVSGSAAQGINGTAGNSSSGGCVAAGGAGALWLLALLAHPLRRRRR